MSVKLTEWRLKLTENVGATLAKLNSGLDVTRNKLSGVESKFQSKSLTEFSGQIPVAGRGLELLSSTGAMAGAAVAAVGGFLYKSAQAAVSYESAMAKINATAQLTPANLSLLKDELVDIGKESGGNFDRIPDAFERINSTVDNVSKSIDILKVANKGAQAGFVDIDLAAQALAQTMSIVGDKDTASGVMDTFLKSKKVGAGEFSDFANYLPSLIAGGANLKIDYKDVAGLYSYMTATSGGSEGAMLLQNAMTAMGKSNIVSGLESKGVKLFDKEGNMRDLGLFFTELHNKMAGMSGRQKSDFLESIGLRDVQAKNAFSILSEDADRLRSVLDQVRNSAGEVNIQLGVTVNHTRTWSQINDQVKASMVAIGDAMLPEVDKMFTLLSADAAILKTLFGDKEEQAKRTAARNAAAEYALNDTRSKFGNALGGDGLDSVGRPKDPAARAYYDQQFKTRYDAGVAAVLGPKKDPFGEQEKPSLLNKPTNKKTGEQLQQGLQNISSGGPRNITINFGKLNESIIIQPQTLKEGTERVVVELEDMLVRVINGAELSTANE